MSEKLGQVLITVPFLCFVGVVVYVNAKYHPKVWGWSYGHLEIIVPLGFLAFFALSSLDLRPNRRRVNWLPWDAAWWEFLVSGVTIIPFSLFWLLASITIFVLAPFVLPYKLMAVYVLGTTATLPRAVMAFPLIFLTTSFSFFMAYMALMVRKLGNLTKDKKELYLGGLGEPWPILDTFYFSLSTMVKGAQQYEATGWCRWVALIEVVVARLLELGVVTVGIGVILKRMASK